MRRCSILSHYFENDQNLTSQPRALEASFAGRAYTFLADRGVFSARRIDDGTRILTEALLGEDLGTDLLDLGCGYGPIGIVLADQFPALRVTMVDVNRRSIDLAKKNIATRRLDARVIALVSDGYAEVRDCYDTIVTNPPIRAGKEVVYRFYREAKDHLRPAGKLYLVVRKDQGAASTYAYLKTFYRHVTRLCRDAGYHVYQAHD